MVQWDEIELDRDSTVPLYAQLSARVRELIDAGRLREGTKVPPSRELATALGINRNTVTSAFDQLRTEGYVRSRVGQGTFVSRARAESSPFRFRFSRAAAAAAERVRPAGDESGHPDNIDFASLVPDEELFPIEPFRAAVDAALVAEGKKLLQYGPAAGHPPLRDYIAERLRARGVTAERDNVLIVNGSQQALDLVCRTLLDPGDRVAVESPTYTIVLPLLAHYQTRVFGVPMGGRGIQVDALESALAREPGLRLLYTMPTFHNPTGITADLETRERLLALAARYGFPVVEDDFDSELRFEGEALPPLKALDARDGTIHIGTFSKGLFPGLRLGWIVAPRDAVEAITQSKLIADYHTGLLLQASVLEFCRAGHYDRHLDRLVGIYRDKNRALLDALSRHLPADASWTKPEGGFAFWLTLPSGMSSETVARDASREGVLVTPGHHFFADANGDRFLRLSISRVPVERIEDGVERLGAVLERHSARGEEEPARPREQEPAFHI